MAVTGRDEAAATLAESCREAGIAPSFVGDSARPTTTKMRVVTDRNQQVARIDYESDSEVNGEIEERIVSEIGKHAPRCSAIVVSDNGILVLPFEREGELKGSVERLRKGEKGRPNLEDTASRGRNRR